MATSLPLRLQSCLPIVPEGIIPTWLRSGAMHHPWTCPCKTYSTWHIDSIACVAATHLACCAGCDALQGPAAWPGFPKGAPLITWEACAVLSGWLAWQVCTPFHLLVHCIIFCASYVPFVSCLSAGVSRAYNNHGEIKQQPPRHLTCYLLNSVYCPGCCCQKAYDMISGS